MRTDFPPSMLVFAALLMTPGLWGAFDSRWWAGVFGFGLFIVLLLGLAVRNALRRSRTGRQRFGASDRIEDG